MDLTALRFLADSALEALANLDEVKRQKEEEKVQKAKEEAEAYVQSVYLKRGLKPDYSCTSSRSGP